MQWRIVELRIGRICHGEPVCDRYHLRLYPTVADAYILGSCHFGNIIEYDTVTNLSWSVDVRTHAIAQIVDKVLSEPWPAANELGLEVPPSKRQDDCVVSYRVPSRKVELFSHWYGAAAGLLQMGLRKLQLMNRQTFFSGCPYTPLPKASLPHTVGHNKLVLERMFVTDRQSDEKELRDVLYNSPSFVQTKPQAEG